jgi:hypothetical protein
MEVCYLKKVKFLCTVLVSGILMTGCVDAMPDLTADESDMISEYAASLLLKYSPNYNYKIVSDDELEAALLELAVEEASQQEESSVVNIEAPSETVASEETEGATEPETGTDTETVTATEAASETGQSVESESSSETGKPISDTSDLAGVLGIDGVSIKYSSYEICDSYPKNNSGFSVSASQGQKLIVIHFDMTNTSGESMNCDLYDYGINVRVSINGSRTLSALSTLLPNELMSFMDTVDAGETVDLVAVVSFNDISDDNLTALSVQVSTSAGIGQSITID